MHAGKMMTSSHNLLDTLSGSFGTETVEHISFFLLTVTESLPVEIKIIILVESLNLRNV